MAANIFLTDEDSDVQDYLRAKIGSHSDACSLVRSVTNTAAGPTSGIQITRAAAGTALAWITDPLDGQDLTAAAWEFHVWAKESNVLANAALRFQVYKYTNAEAGTAALDDNNGTELTATIADYARTTGVATVTALNDKDRLVIKVIVEDAGTLVTGHTVTLAYNGEHRYAEGDSYVVCPDTIAVTVATPAASRTRIRTALKDDASSNNLLTDAQVNQVIDAAIREYSRDRPRIAYALASGDGSAYDFRLPRLWVWGLSYLEEVEYPAGEQYPTLVDPNEWHVHESALGVQPVRKIRLNGTPASGTDNIQFKYSALHVHNDELDSIPYADFDAVMWLATSYGALALAGKMSASIDSTINADSADYRGGQNRWENVAKRYRELYLDHIGSQGPNSGGLASGTGRGAAITQDWDVNLQSGSDRLWHSRRNR